MEYYDSLENVDQPIGEATVEAEFARASTLKSVPRPAASQIREELEGYLTVDVYETPVSIVIQSALAGVNPDELDISATSESVTIRGERHREKESSEKYIHQECYWGKFYRSITLPQEVDPENATVHCKNGILTIRLPKAEKHRTRKLKVHKAD